MALATPRAAVTDTAVDIPAPDAAARSAAAQPRLAWLDALRGIAVLLVVWEHLSHVLLHHLRLVIEHWFFAGYAGVCLFFLVSGYIVPASLERRGSLSDFWVGRLARLFPLYTLVLATVAVLQVVGLRPPVQFAAAHPVQAVLAYATMLPDLLWLPDLLGVTWTLAFEMVFYLLVAALYAIGRRRASAPVALTLAGSALLLGPAMPVLWLSSSPAATRVVLVVTAAVMAAAFAAMIAGRGRLAVAGAVAGGLLALTLLYTNQHAGHRWDGLLIPALMFTGTVIYRVQQGEIRWWWLPLVAVLVYGTWAVQSARELIGYGPPYTQFIPRVPITLAVVALLFGAGFALRRVRLPRALTLIGVVSYSVYLLHQVVFDLVHPYLGPLLRGRGAVQAAGFVLLTALVIALAWGTHRLVELPGQRLGRRVARWLAARRGAPAGPVPVPAAVVIPAQRQG